jgi:hypothetical protein
MGKQSPLKGKCGSNTGRLAGATTNTAILGTQQEHRHKLVHRDTPNTATKHMTQDAHLKIVCKTGSSKNQKQHAVECEYIHIEANGRQSIVQRKAGACRAPVNKIIAARNGKPRWSTMAFVCTVCEIKHHNVVSAGIFADEFSDKSPHKWAE